jgi:hypothetical protein
MKEIVFFSREPWKIAQTTRETQNSERSETQSPTVANSNNNYLGLIFLSIFIFLFLAFLLFKRKSQEARLSIFVSLFLGFLLAIYTSVQVATQSLRGGETTRTANPPERELISSQTNPKETRDRRSDSNTRDPQEKRSIETKEETTKEETTTEKTTTNDESTTINAESRTSDRDSSEENPPETSEDRDTQTSQTSSTQAPSPQATNSEQQETNTSTLTQNNTNNTTTRPRNIPLSNPRNPPNSPRNSRAFSSSVQTSLLRPILKLGDRGFDVTLLQTILKELNYYTLEIDGYYGRSTELAVQNFQRQNNLLVDGIVGFSTCNILKAKTENTEIECSFQ